MHGLYDLLGYCYGNSFNDYKNALKYGLYAVKYAEQAGDSTTQLGTIYTRLGHTYSALQEHENAQYYFAKAYSVFEKYNDVNNIYVVTSEVISNLDNQQRYEDSRAYVEKVAAKYPVPDYLHQDFDALFLRTYTKVRDYKKARIYVDIILKNPSSRRHLISIVQMVDYYIATAQYTHANDWLATLDTAITQSSTNKFFHQFWTTARRSRIYEKTGDYKQALEQYKIFKTASDSLYNTKKANQLTATQIEFDTERKDQDIKLKTQSIELLTSQNELQDQQIRQSKLMKNLVLGGIIVLLIILGLLYNQYRLKQRINREIQHRNLSLQQLVNQKEWLLKEIHHRVKNNLQTVVSLLESQAAYLKNDALQAIQESQNRIYSMSLIHQKLYQSENIAAINLSNYLPELVHYLRDTFNDKRVQFNLDIAPLEMDVSQAVPLGLIVNEAVTNAIKYAFAGKEGPHEISIRLTEGADDRVKLEIADNGLGLPPGFDGARNSGLGLKLMRGLTDDIGGDFAITSENGTRIQLEFTANKPLYTVNEEVVEEMTLQLA